MKEHITPEVGDVWRDSDNEIVYIVKIYKNISVFGTKNEETYRVLEYTNQNNINVMECHRHHLVEYLGKSKANIEQLFEVGDNGRSIEDNIPHTESKVLFKDLENEE